MNLKLLEQIVRHIFANFMIVSSEFVNEKRSKSLMSTDFLLKEKLSFDTDNGKIFNRVWGCQLSALDHEVKILLGDCSQDTLTKEYCLLIQLKGSPAYGLYLIDTDDSEISAEPMIACTMNEKDWLECNTYLQATFLAAMENLKELGFTWKKCTDYKSQYEMMKSFIEFHDAHYEAE
jgi:hypothetical protein